MTGKLGIQQKRAVSFDHHPSRNLGKFGRRGISIFMDIYNIYIHVYIFIYIYICTYIQIWISMYMHSTDRNPYAGSRYAANG